MSKFSLITALIISPQILLAEQITTTDGRRVDLKEDGTYEILSSEAVQSDAFVELNAPLFVHNMGKYNDPSIRFMPKFRNISDTSIVGLRFKISFFDAFGDEVHSTTGDVSERVAPGSTSKADVFYVYEDNQFMSGEPYDKLLPMVSGNTGSIEVEVISIAFDGGRVEKF